MATLEHFLRTGELGSLKPGMTQDDVRAILGPPPDESVRNHPQIWKYGGMQLSFVRRDGEKTRGLAHVGMYFFPAAEAIPESLRPTDWLPSADTTIERFREYLAAVNLTTSANVSAENNECLVLPSRVRITFEEDRLHSIQFAASRPALSRKQLSISIPENTLSSLRDIAGKLNRTVPELCSEWIAERANAHTPTNGAPHAG